MDCTLYTQKQYTCLFCHVRIHRGDSGCDCSTLRASFGLASLCASCAGLYDELINDENYKPTLKFLIDKSYWEGVGPVVDF